MTLEELLAAAAKATGMSESMVKRSAAARAKAEGTTIEAVLAGWAGVEAPAAEAAPAGDEAEAAPPAAATTPEAGAAAPAPEAAAAAAPTAPAGEPTVAVEESGEEVSAPAPAPAAEAPPAEVVPAGAIPRWLAALFVAVPLFALAYVAFLPNGPACGDAGNLAVDPLSGEAVNCDGTPIGGEPEPDYYAIGEAVFTGRGACFACHGAAGQGGVGPAFVDGALLATFPEGSCATHQQWVTLGTAEWPDPTYGANEKPKGVVGQMPTFDGVLTPEEIAAVALYERVAFGGQDLEAAKADCIASEAPTAAGG